MFAAAVAGGVLLKLPPGDIVDLIGANRGVPFVPAGEPMRGWVVAPGVDAGQVADAERFVRVSRLAGVAAPSRRPARRRPPP